MTPAQHFTRRLLRLLRVLMQVVAIFLGVALAFLTVLVLTAGAGRGWVAWGIVLVGMLASYAVLGRADRRTSRRWLTSIAAGAALAGCATVCIPTVSTQRRSMPDPPGVTTQRWTLSTGSRVAVYHYPPAPGRPRKPAPLVYLHGGPIRSISLLDHSFLRGFADRGYDVYLYEQAGAGRSDLLPIAEYSITREVADLNAFIDHLKMGPVDIIGFSAGGSLLTRALADPASEARIRRAVIAEPGPMDGPTAALTGPKGRANAAGMAPLMAGPRSVTMPRYAAAFGLVRIGLLEPDQSLVEQEEGLNAFTAADLDNDTASAYCARDAHRIPIEDDSLNFSFNVAASIRVMETIRSSDSLAPALSRSRTPAMLLMAECSAQVRGWATTIIRHDPALQRVHYMPSVGHRLWNGLDDNTARAYTAIAAFLEDRRAPLPNYPTASDLDIFETEGR